MSDEETTSVYLVRMQWCMGKREKGDKRGEGYTELTVCAARNEVGEVLSITYKSVWFQVIFGFRNSFLGSSDSIYKFNILINNKN